MHLINILLLLLQKKKLSPRSTHPQLYTEWWELSLKDEKGMAPAPIRSVKGQSFSHAEIGDFSWYTFYIILMDNLISFAFIWFFWTTPFFQRAVCTGRSRLCIARNLSASNRMAIGLFFTTMKIQAVSYFLDNMQQQPENQKKKKKKTNSSSLPSYYIFVFSFVLSFFLSLFLSLSQPTWTSKIYLVYGPNNVLFWATCANSLFILFLIVDAVAFNRGPFKHLRGNSKAGVLQPLRTKDGSVVSMFDAAQWALVSRNRTSAAVPFVINPNAPRVLIDEFEDVMQDELPSLPPLLGHPGTGYVKLRFGPCDVFRTNVGLAQWNKMMVDNSKAMLTHWMEHNSLKVRSSSNDMIDAHRGRAMLVMRSDGALRSVVYQVPNVRTIFQLCGIINEGGGGGGSGGGSGSGSGKQKTLGEKSSNSSSISLSKNSAEMQPRLRRDTPFTLESVAGLHQKGFNNDSFGGDGMATPPQSPQQAISFTTGLRPSTRLPTSSSSLPPVSLVSPISPVLPIAHTLPVPPTLPTLPFVQTSDLPHISSSTSSTPSTTSSPTYDASLVFEIVMKSYVGDDSNKKYWYYASYSEFNLEPNAMQKESLKIVVDHLNGSKKPSRSLRSVRCKNIFTSGDHQLLAKTRMPVRRRSRNSDWLMLRS